MREPVGRDRNGTPLYEGDICKNADPLYISRHYTIEVRNGVVRGYREGDSWESLDWLVLWARPKCDMEATLVEEIRHEQH